MLPPTSIFFFFLILDFKRGQSFLLLARYTLHSSLCWHFCSLQEKVESGHTWRAFCNIMFCVLSKFCVECASLAHWLPASREPHRERAFCRMSQPLRAEKTIHLVKCSSYLPCLFYSRSFDSTLYSFFLLGIIVLLPVKGRENSCWVAGYWQFCRAASSGNALLKGVLLYLRQQLIHCNINHFFLPRS